MAALFKDFVQVPGVSPRAEAFLVHDIPGRLRIVVPALKGEDRRAVALRADLQRLPAVQALQFNALTGSVLMAYDGLVRSRDAILRVLYDAGYGVVRPAPAVAGTPRPGGLQGATGAAIKAVIHCMLDLAVESAIVAAV
ncbi:MAG TPA: hypothetical protein VFE41_02250 [Acetobacteraceae bacterium]|jgi:hypothetical protein|nr:hypothetical protein [Acetobacteraceae bacterium]